MPKRDRKRDGKGRFKQQTGASSAPAQMPPKAPKDPALKAGPGPAATAAEPRQQRMREVVRKATAPQSDADPVQLLEQRRARSVEYSDHALRGLSGDVEARRRVTRAFGPISWA